MLKIGDCVTYILDGTKGIVIRLDGEMIYVLWEDYFASCEKNILLEKDEELTTEQGISSYSYEQSRMHA
ncbi:MAG TPA: hypothetical protein VJ824_07495 [Bacillota bacterium]|nr:hypothetical protein [Bacillota bacterium]